MILTIWNTFCDDIKKKKGALEMTFEVSAVRGFLQALGWSIYGRNLKEQVSKYNGKDRTDFFLHTKDNEKETQIVVELKRPEHKQKQKDIEQIERYMKVYGSRFGIYLGEKLEVFYRMPKGDDFVAVSVTTIDLTHDHPAAEQLLSLLRFDNYKKEKFNKYCNEHLEVNRYAKEWQTPEGKQTLYNAIIEKCNLSPVVASKLRSILTFQIDESQIDIVTEPAKTLVAKTISETTLSDSQKTWLICYDSKFFNVADCLRKYGQVYWRHKGNVTNIKKGDIAYLYASSPESAIRFKVEVTASQLPYSPIMDEGDEFSKEGTSKIDDANYLYFLVRLISETHSPALKHTEMMEKGLMGKRPATTILSKKEFKTLKQYIEMHFKDAVPTKEQAVIKNKKKAESKNQDKPKKKKRPPFKFHMIGMKPGTLLSFTLADIQVIVASDDKVEYEGKQYMLSQFCQQFDPKEGSENQQYQGPAYFTFQGKTLTKLRDEQEGLLKKKD